MTCIIVDDEPLAVKLIESYVAKTPDLKLLGSYTDSVEAITEIKENPADLLFLDIQMPDINGMELARLIPEKTRVIFTTAFKEYAFESYEVSALDFLLKPIRYNKFIAAVEKARK
ncbi:MAG: response regulator, partial [Prevotella sp.]|nr:response regulator [Prevotella sp.]